MRPFEGIRILDCTHVLAGPFAAYQLAVLGADVIKVDDPNEPDQSRESGADHALNKAGMGTGFLTQGSNKRAIALNLKTEGGREALKRLVVDWADVLVENYRPGAFKALGLGYEDLSRLKPTLIYASMTAFGQGGPRGTQTAYDHAIQATSGITASTGTEASGPIKAGAPMVDYATGTMGAFAISAALYQTLRTGQGQYIDMAMLDVAMILQGSHITDYLHSGHHPKRNGNVMRFAASSAFPTKDGMVQLAASNARQHRRFYEAVGDPEEAKRSSLEERYERHAEKLAAVGEKMKEKTADEWETYLQSRHVPATRVRELREALADPHLQTRGVLHRHDDVPGVGKPVTVRWRHSSSPTTGRRSSARRRAWASTPTRRWPPSGTRPIRSRRCADRARSPEAGSIESTRAPRARSERRREHPDGGGLGMQDCQFVDLNAIMEEGRQVTVLWQEDESLAFVANGRAYRSEFHVNPSAETMLQLRGEMRLHYLTPEGEEKVRVLKEGEYMYCPPGLPHSPRFPPGAFALITERRRRPGERDRFLWFCERCRAQVYEAVFEVRDYAENPVSLAYREYYGSREHRTCKACGHVMPAPDDQSYQEANPARPAR